MTPEQIEKFLRVIGPHAVEAGRTIGVDPRLIIAQSALETGWGKAAPGNNYFGIKSHGVPGGQPLQTSEVDPATGQRYTTKASFRTYDDPKASVDDYANFLLTNDRYKPLLEAKGLAAQVAALGKSGYATDPNYAKSVSSIAGGIIIDDTTGMPTFAGMAPTKNIGTGPGGAGVTAATPEAIPYGTAGNPAFDAMRTAGDGDLAGYGGSPKLPTAGTAKPFDFGGLLGAGMRQVAAGEPQAAPPPPWMQQAMTSQPQAHRPQAQPGGLLAAIFPDEKRRRLMLGGLLGDE